MRVSPWSRFVRPEGLVRRRYVMAPNSVELAARKDIDLTGPGQVLPEEVPRTILVGRRSDETETGPPGPGPRVSRASPRGGFVGSSATGAIVSATAASSDLSFLSVGGVFRTSFVTVLPRLCHGAAGGRFD